MPLDDCTVIGDTLYGTMGPYVMKINGTTGKLIASARVCTPMIGPCRITQLGGTLYVSTWNNRATDLFPVAYPANWFFNKAIWPVNPTTLAVGTGIELAQLAGLAACGWSEPMYNIHTLRGIGAYIYVVHGNSVSSNMCRVNPSTLAHSNFCAFNQSGLNPSVIENLDDDGTYLYMGDPDNTGVLQFEIVTLADGSAVNTNDFVNTASNQVRAVAITSGTTVYGVCGTATLCKVTFPSPGTSSTFNLATIQAGVRPFRIRYNSNDGLLYIPCQGQDGVIVWNPATDTGVFKSGIISPIDACFTTTKKWAICNSSVGVQEIV